jgi:hypothetical protein
VSWGQWFHAAFVARQSSRNWTSHRLSLPTWIAL